MAVRINPCFGCPLRDGCEQKAVFSARVRGLGLRSATFTCSRLSAAIAPGRRIVVTMPTFSCNSYDNEVTSGRREVKATIHASHGNEFACVVDQADIDEMVEDEVVAENADPNKIRWRKTMRHSRIVRFLDEPNWTHRDCGNLVSPDGACHTRDGHCFCKQYGDLAA